MGFYWLGRGMNKSESESEWYWNRLHSTHGGPQPRYLDWPCFASGPIPVRKSSRVVNYILGTGTDSGLHDCDDRGHCGTFSSVQHIICL
jgi:hypothetical protein